MPGVARIDRVTWGVTVALFLLAAVIYLADDSTQRFEQLLPDVRFLASFLPVSVALLPDPVHHHFADFAWSLLVAMVARECWPMPRRAPQLALLLVVATSWEWLQFAGIAPGQFDPIDIAVGAVAALGVFLLRPVRNRRMTKGNMP